MMLAKLLSILEFPLKVIALLSSGLFTGAAFYLTAVEHPARIGAWFAGEPLIAGCSFEAGSLDQSCVASGEQSSQPHARILFFWRRYLNCDSLRA